MARSYAERLLNVSLVVVTCCALVMTVLVVRREFASTTSQSASSPATARIEPKWRSYADTGEVMGPSRAPVTIVEFSDFQCPYCANLATVLSNLRRKWGDRVTVVYRHFPSAGHPQAMPAALAAECAGEQGRFEAFHDSAFRIQPLLSSVRWVALAAAAGVPDTAQFIGCLSAPRVRARIDADVAAGTRLGVRGTPTLLVNDHEFVGVPLESSLDSLIASLLGAER